MLGWFMPINRLANLQPRGHGPPINILNWRGKSRLQLLAGKDRSVVKRFRTMRVIGAIVTPRVLLITILRAITLQVLVNNYQISEIILLILCVRF